MDLKDVWNVNFDQLTDNEKDDVCHKLVSEDVGTLTASKDLKNALKLFQSLLRLKVEQVDGLGLELDELASKQGEDEARFVQEIENLRAQLKSPREYNQNEGASDDDLRQLLHTSELNAQKLLAELQAQEQEQMSNKMEMEKLESQLATLENERFQLKQELSALRDEMHSQQKEVEPHIGDPQKKFQQLVESLRQKNKHLSALLNDVEASEKENITLREKLTNIKIELAEATKNIMQTTGELVTQQIIKEEQAERICHLEQMCEALRHQVEDLNIEKQRRDAEFEVFKHEIDVRVQEWKEVVENKEKELASLHEYLAHRKLKGQTVMKSSDSEQIALLSQTVQKRECQIDELQSQLSQATRDLNETTSLLEKMQQATEISHIASGLQEKEMTQKHLSSAEERIKFLEEKLRDAEIDADGKSEEITKMIIQLRNYETGEFGLTEALAQIKELTQQRSVRDKHIEQLVETANSLKLFSDNLHEENLTLREQLQISPEEHVKTSSMIFRNKEQNVLKVQEQQIDRLQEDLINIKIDRRNLSQQVILLSKQLQEFEAHPQKSSNIKHQGRSQADARAAARKIRALQQDLHQSGIERQSLVDENEALRQGLHDILDSVHNQDGKSSVRLESKVLEHLLHALDSRHISGWYHPAMRIQAKVDVVEGNNEALREQLRSMREEASRTQSELQKAKLQIVELKGNKKETCIPLMEIEEHVPESKQRQEEVQVSLSLPTDLPSQGWKVITKLNKHLMQILYEHELEKSNVAETLSIQRELQLHLDELVSHLVQAIEKQSSEKETWQQEKNKLELQLEEMQAKLSASETEAAKLRSLLDTFTSTDQIKKDITIQEIFNYAALCAEKEKSERMVVAAFNQVEHAKKELQLIKNEWNSSKKWIMKQFGEFLQFKKTSILHMSNLESVLMDSVHISSLNAVIKQKNQVTANYNELLRQHETAMNSSEKEIRKLMSELEFENETKNDLAIRLEEALQKLCAANIHDDISMNDKDVKLARAESEVLRAKQQVSHAEKMCGIAKGEVQQVSERCKALEQEVLALLRNNQQLTSEVSTLREHLNRPHLEDGEELESQLNQAKAEVSELQAYQRHLQELAEISQAQVHMLNHLHERSELQLDSLRQVVFKLQVETDQGAEIARLSEELCASQMNEMVAWNQISGLEKHLIKAQSLTQEQAKEIEDLMTKMNWMKQQNIGQHRKMHEEIIDLRMNLENTLPLTFFHVVVTAFTQRSAECRSLWNNLQEVKAKMASESFNSEETKITCQQSLELQSALKVNHSDLKCQRTIESLAATLTELKLKELKRSRHCELLETNLKQAEERLQNEEGLLFALERQLISFDTKKMQYSLGRYNEGTHQDNMIIAEISQASEKVEDQLDDDQLKSSLSPHKIKEMSQIESLGATDEQKEEQLMSLKGEINNLTENLKRKESELELCQSVCDDLRKSLSCKSTQKYSMTVEHPVSVEGVTTNRMENNVTAHDKVALEATVDSLQNIIIQKEDTICRYQKFLRDVREEDARIISTLQEHLRNQQTDLTAQEQAYVRLKISMRHLLLETSNETRSKAALDLQFTRTNELEDEIALLTTKLSTLSTELQSSKQEAAHWNAVVKQHLSTIDELNCRILEFKNLGMEQKKPIFHSPKHETSATTGVRGSVFMTSSENNKKNKLECCKQCKDALIKRKDNQMQIQLSSEVTELRNKIQRMEDQEQQQKSEIQRLRDQIPIYSRRSQQLQSESILPKRETELQKKINTLEQQVEQMAIENEKAVAQQSQQEIKKIKSAENVARWDERKKHQIQIEKLKNSLQEQTNEVALLHDKIERMHVTVHRLEREKVTLEHQNRNMHRLEQENNLLEKQIKTFESNNASQCVLDKLQQDRDSLYAEVKMLRAKQALTCQESKECFADAVQKEKADLMKANLELECENLELKLELEKVRSEAPCLQHKVKCLERMLLDASQPRETHLFSEGMTHTSNMVEQENKALHEKMQHLTAQLEASHHRIKVLENSKDNRKIISLQSELHDKSLLLGKVKTLLERAALKERELIEQVQKLESALSKR